MNYNILQKICMIIYLIIMAVSAIINFGTFIYFIPIIGEIATLVFIPTYEINIIITSILVIISGIYVYKNREKKGKIIFLISLLILISIGITSVQVITNVSNQGENISFTEVFEMSDFSNIKVNTEYYTDQNGEKNGVNVYYTEDEIKDKPIIIYIHGGGWIKGSKDDHISMNKNFAKNGYIVISLDYELSTEEKNNWNFTEKQLCYGILWVKNNAYTYNGDTNKIYMIGDSAGGNLLLNISYKINNGEYDTIDQQELPKINAVSVIYPVINLIDFYNNESLIMGDSAKKMVTSYVGGNPHEYSKRYESLNPINHITDKIPPTLIVVGERDSLVPPNSTYIFAERLEKNKLKNKLIRIPYCNHAGDNSINNFMGQTYIKNTLKWFNSYK